MRGIVNLNEKAGGGGGGGVSMHSATKFKCNFAVIGVVHSGIKMTGSYFSEFK